MSVKLEELKENDILVLTQDVEGTQIDRRQKYDWRVSAVLKTGMRFIVRREYAGEFSWLALESLADRYSASHRLTLHTKPQDEWALPTFKLGQAILNASDIASDALTNSDRYAQLGMEYAGHFREVVDVLLAEGAITWDQIKMARGMSVCGECDKLAVRSDDKGYTFCADHGAK